MEKPDSFFSLRNSDLKHKTFEDECSHINSSSIRSITRNFEGPFSLKLVLQSVIKNFMEAYFNFKKPHLLESLVRFQKAARLSRCLLLRGGSTQLSFGSRWCWKPCTAIRIGFVEYQLTALTSWKFHSWISLLATYLTFNLLKCMGIQK